MLSLTANISALLLYLCASTYLLTLIKRQKNLQQRPLFVLTASAIIIHGIGLQQLMILPNGINLGIHNMASLIFLSINAIVLASSIRKPLHNLFIFLFPLSIISIALSIAIKQSEPHFIAVNLGVAAHILLSIIAYSILALASLQAILWSWQNHQLKQHRLTGIMKLLPSLQTMESLMFELVWAGVALLGLGIVVGFIYLDNIFAQHLVHKTVLSLFALCVFATLLWGRHKLGWRGNTAGKWVLSGFCLLMLSYFGSKLVLEVILR